MTIIVSFRHLYNDWYAGELYTKFFSLLKETYKHINFEYVDIVEFGKRFGCFNEYSPNGLPTIFSPLNLIIFNPKTEKIFIHSLHDYASVMISSLEQFQKQIPFIKFCCSSNLTTELLSENKHDNIIIQPSFYCLENLSDYERVEKLKMNKKVYENPFFVGLTYGDREIFKEIFKKSARFDFLDKRDDNSYFSKDEYYERVSRCLYGMSFNGAAKICYRDLEYFGLGVLNLRQRLGVCTVEPLIEDIHYINFFDDDIRNTALNDNSKKSVIDTLENKLDNIIKNNKVDFIINNARNWYSNNCTPSSNVKWLDKFLKDFKLINI